MALLFWITTIILFIQGLYKVFVKKDYFNIFVYIFLGIYFPLFLYLLNWSLLIETGISNKFYFIFICINIFVIPINMISNKTLNDNLILVKINKEYLFVINIFYLGLVLLENYLGSGYLLPALNNIDIHTYSAPIISYFVDCLFVILLGNFLYWYITKKKIYLVWLLIFILLPIIGKSARMDVIISLVQLFSFIIFLYINDKKLGNRIKRKALFYKTRHKIILIIALISIVALMVNYTNYRMNHYGKYELNYSETISYTGPEHFEDVVSVYYGYFPLSFNNLNVNIKNREITHNYVGLYSYKSLYFGVFRLHNFFGLNPYQPDTGNQASSGSATVPTGFFDFYYDYGMFLFIPIFLGFVIYVIFRRNLEKKNSNIISYFLYFYWVPLWFFMSFQNVIYSATMIFIMIFSILYIKYFFKVEYVSK